MTLPYLSVFGETAQKPSPAGSRSRERRGQRAALSTGSARLAPPPPPPRPPTRARPALGPRSDAGARARTLTSSGRRAEAERPPSRAWRGWGQNKGPAGWGRAWETADRPPLVSFGRLRRAVWLEVSAISKIICDGRGISPLVPARVW